MGLGEVEREYVLVDVEQAGEHRVAMLVRGESAVVIEQTCGPDTEAAYGAPTHTRCFPSLGTCAIRRCCPI